VTITGNRELQVMAKTFAVTGGSDPTKATKKLESFGIQDQTPTTSISGPSGSVLTSTTFIATGTASDDKGVNALTYWFRNSSNQYLQEDGSVSSNFNTFRGQPDVAGATSATWQYEVTLPHEGEWRMSATAIDNAGQSDLRSATRDWLITSTGVAPTVAINAPAPMTPPTAAPALTVAPGSPMTFSGTANDEANLANVEISLRNNTTREQLASDGTWGTDVVQGWYRISPQTISGASYNWSYTTPFNLRQGQYSFSVRANDDIGLTTSSTNQGRLTINAPGRRGQPAQRAAERHRHRLQHRGAAPRPGRHGHRRRRREGRPGRPRGRGHRALRPAERHHVGRVRHPAGDPGLAQRDQHQLDAVGTRATSTRR
jgi:hypothetical protein